MYVCVCVSVHVHVHTNSSAILNMRNKKQKTTIFFRFYVFFVSRTSQQQVEQRLGQRLATVDRGRQQLLALGNAVAAKANTLVRVEQRRLPDHARHAAHAAVGLCVDVRNNCV